MARQEREERDAEALMEMDERKRPFNSGRGDYTEVYIHTYISAYVSICVYNTTSYKRVVG